MSEDCLFVYGTLRPGFDGDMAVRLRAVARHVGPASAAGALYLVDDYPAFLPGTKGRVAGDLFVLDDPASALAWLDDYEQCTPDWPQPHEYRRERLWVDRPDGRVEAWTYVYAWDMAGLKRIEGGDFLAGRG